MKPFFCFLGGKWRMAPRYPLPEHPVIIEPFAGAAGYSSRYAARKVRLYDLDPVIVGIWSWLIKVKASEVRRLPLKFDHIDQVKTCQEAKWLIGFWLDKGGVRPAVRPSPRMTATDTPKRAWQHRPKSHWGVEIRERIASQVELIRHWKVEERSYLDVPDRTATWFIDPPYQVAGTAYKFGARLIDYKALATFVKTRTGLVIACENSGARWLPFRDFMKSKSTHKGGHTINHEVIYIQRRGHVEVQAA